MLVMCVEINLGWSEGPHSYVAGEENSTVWREVQYH
jgi:hypothetical protein